MFVRPVGIGGILHPYPTSGGIVALTEQLSHLLQAIYNSW